MSPTASAATTAAEAVELRPVAPEVTGDGIDGGTGDHLVALDAGGASKGFLWLFLPGTGGRPDQYEMLAQRAAQAGFHTINLAYVNDKAVNRFCPGQGAACPGAMRREIITGEDTSDIVEVAPPNSIVNRLAALLRYLDGRYPQEGWSSYLHDGSPRWERIRVGGHSQGGGHAAFLGKLYRLDRVVLFSATEPAAWTSLPGLTPANRYYAFAHTLEDGYAGMRRSWQLLGINGPGVSVDAGGTTYEGARILTTSLSGASCQGAQLRKGFYHRCHVVDWDAPLLPDGVTPLYAEVWDYLFGA
jgi:hypothetical protein